MAPKTSRRIFEFRLILACLAAASTLYAQSPDADPQVVVDSMLEARARLQSGHFRAVGTVEQVLLDHEVSDVLPSEIEGIFDHHRGLVRYETRGEYRSIISSSENLTPEVIEQLRSRTYSGPHKVREKVAMFVRSPEYMVEWFAIGRRDEDHASVHLDIHEPDAPPSYRYLLPFDPSSAGLFNPVEFTVARTPPQIMEPLLADSVQTTVQTNAVGEIELTFMLFEGRLRRRFTIDPANGFTATRMEIVQFDESGQLEELPRLESTADWERRGDDVWVPVRISVVRHVPSGNRDAYEYDLHWESVNPSAFDDELFTWQSFEGVWDGTHVVDRRQGKLEHIDTIGKPFVKIPSAAERAGVPLDQPKPLSPTRYWLIVVNAIALGILGVILIVRGLRKRRTPAP